MTPDQVAQIAATVALQIIAIPLGFWIGWTIGGWVFDR
jgi:hypothetical protein